MSFDAKNFLAHVGDKPGVYQMLAGDGKLLYVGKAKSLQKRLASYFRSTGLPNTVSPSFLNPSSPRPVMKTNGD